MTPEKKESPDPLEPFNSRTPLVLNAEEYRKLHHPEERPDIGFACLGLHHPQDSRNVGTVLRAADCFGAAFIALCGNRFKKAGTDVWHSFRRIPVLQVEDLQEIVPFGCVPVAVELADGAVSLVNYRHPHRAFYIFGGEHETLGRKVLSWCRDIVYIPTNGSLNLGVCANIVLYDRFVKEQSFSPTTTASASHDKGTP